MRSRLIEWERANGYKARYVAEKLGISDSAYSKIKRGEQQPTIEMVSKLHSEFGVEMEQAIKLLEDQ